MQNGDTLNAIQALRLLAIGYYHLGEVYDSETAAVEALNLLENSQRQDTMIENRKAIFNQLGQLYRATDNYDKALEIYQQALQYAQNEKDSIALMNNKANIFKDRNDFKRAANILQEAYKKMGVVTDSLRLAFILDNLGHAQSQINNPEALINLKKAQNIREMRNHTTGLYSSYHNLALHYFHQNLKDTALQYAEKAYQTAGVLNSPTYVEEALSLFVLMNENPKIVRFKKLTDSLAREKQLAENKNAHIKYNVEKERKKTSEALFLKEKEKTQKIIFFAIATIIFLASIFVYFTQRIKHKKEKIVQVHKTEARISKKVHDEVANDVYHLMVKIQGKVTDETVLLDDLERIYSKTRDISKENSAIDFDIDFSLQLKDLLLNYQNENVTIATRNISKIEWNDISEIKKTAIYRVLQELMTNMKKHSQATAVVLIFQQIGKKINVEYTDNGIGCMLNNKNGLQNAENRIQAINGTITFDSEPGKGFKSKIKI